MTLQPEELEHLDEKLLKQKYHAELQVWICVVSLCFAFCCCSLFVSSLLSLSSFRSPFFFFSTLFLCLLSSFVLELCFSFDGLMLHIVFSGQLFSFLFFACLIEFVHFFLVV